MRLWLAVAAVTVLTACGAAKPVHYRVHAALDCIRRTDTQTFPHTPRNGIYAAYISDDRASAIETVAVAFPGASIDIVADSDAPTRLGAKKPTWTETRGDAEVWGFGPYEPRFAKRHGVTDAQAKAAAGALGPKVRTAIDTCLKQNER